MDNYDTDADAEFKLWAIQELMYFAEVSKLWFQGSIGIWYVCPSSTLEEQHIHEYLFGSNQWVTSKE